MVWAESRGTTAAANRVEFVARVAEALAQKSCDEWIERFADASIPCGPVNNMQRLLDDPQVLHRKMVVDVPHKTIGTLHRAMEAARDTRTPKDRN